MLDFAPFVIATSLVVGIAAVFLVELGRRAVRPGPDGSGAVEEAGASMLFHRGRLVDATPGGQILLAGGPGDPDDVTLPDAVTALAPRFPGLRPLIDDQRRQGRATLLASDGSAHLDVFCDGDVTRLDLVSTDDHGRQVLVGAADLEGLRQQLASLRGVAEALPYPIWCTDAQGQVSWVNRAYLDLCRRHLGPESVTSWPLPRLFAPGDAGRTDPVSGRLWLTRDGAEDQPFEVTARAHEGGHVHSAIPADAAVRTETSLRDFVQTLTKTFAQIAIGLAVFSRDRRLVLFNPALGELTGLRPETLALRPTLFEFLDILRDRRLMPEPKDYKSWRQRLADIRNPGADGQLAETWQLPDGRTFRITALPQAEGALALLFEDITSQMLQSRTFRGTLETHQLVLDRRSEAIAVFSADGSLILCNDPYDALWQTRVADTVSPVSLSEALGSWQAATQPTPAWATFPQTARGAPWSARLHMTDGRSVECLATALPGSCLLVEFRIPVAGRSDSVVRSAQRRLRLTA